ncbi:MAG: hypothetical protein IRZ09_11060 [Variibacter sp.]|nr:hypothetical protein [Variibacter sp.]
MVLLCGGLLLVGGCARTGDFGRGVGEAELPPAEDPVQTGSVPASSFPLTDDERQLRALARNLLASPSEQGRFVLSAVDGAGEHADPAARYVDYLVNGPFRSAAARYARLIDDTRNDLTRLDPFFALARRVADLDRKRERSLAYVTGLTQEELTNARRRVRENMMLIAEVHRVMRERAAMYRIALERLVIALPSPMAVEAERQRLELERRLGEIQVFAVAPGPRADRGNGSRPLPPPGSDWGPGPRPIVSK